MLNRGTMTKTVMKCDRCGHETEISSIDVRPTGWLELSIETDLCRKCTAAYHEMQERLSEIREEFFNGSRKTE
jgi:DNA-directed RNA polymerase subunit M/transcription elongation factor TFIIS